MKVIANHSSWEGKFSFWNGGNGPLWPSDGTSVCALVSSATARSNAQGPAPPGLSQIIGGASNREQQQERDQQREDAERLGHRKAEDQDAELALRGRRIAQRRREIIAEDGADADAGA